MPGKLDQASLEDFELLGLDYGAAPEEVKKAYKSFVKTWHPDRFPQGSRQQRLAEEKLKDINGAYQRIRNNWATDILGNMPQDIGAEEPKVHEHPDDSVRTTTANSSSFAFHLRQAYHHIATLFHTVTLKPRPQENKAYRAWMMILLALLLLVILIETKPFSFLEDRKGHSNGRKVDTGPSARWVPLPTEAPEVTKPLEGPTPAPIQPSSELDEKVAAPPESEHANLARPFFTLGPSKKEVFRVQGKPTKVYGQTWVYGLSDVTFREGKVWRYHNFDGTLLVQILPSRPIEESYGPKSFSLGSSKDEVIWVQGTPTHLEGNKWSYGFSEVYFKEGVVSGFNNFFNNLRVTMRPSKELEAFPSRDYFTIGSSPDEVLAVQGTPTVVQGNIWSYQLSEVLFAEGKVRNVNDFSGNLKFLHSDSRAEN